MGCAPLFASSKQHLHRQPSGLRRCLEESTVIDPQLTSWVTDVQLRYQHPTNPDDVRTVTVPMHGCIRAGTLRKIAEQCDANEFREWCRWIDEHR
jgi:hypothetical protein